MAKHYKAMKHPLLYYCSIFIVLFCCSNAIAQDGVSVRFDTYSNLELNGYTKQNTLILSSGQDNVALLDKAILDSVDNIVIRGVCIDNTLLSGISKFDVSNAQLYDARGNVDSFFSVFLSMSKARALKIYNTDVDWNFPKHDWSSIKRLEISNCNILSLSEILKQMSGIRYFSVTDSRVSSVSFDTILASLVYLDLSACGLSNIPSCISNCPNLECFRYYGNHFTKTDCSVLKNIISLREIYLGDCGITEFPIELTELPLLHILVLDGNHIENVPDTITGFKELKYLGLGRTSYLLNKNTIDGLDVPFHIGKFPD